MPDQATVETEHGAVTVETSGDNAAMIAERAAALVEQIAQSDAWRVRIENGNNEDGEGKTE